MRLLWPVPGYTTITSGFYDTRPWGQHDAIDIACPVGSDVVAAAKGRVRIGTYDGQAGNFIELDHGNGFRTRYLHLSVFQVQIGQEVQRGQHIALSGDSGFVQGAHLHFAVWVTSQETALAVQPDPDYTLGMWAVNPELLFGEEEEMTKEEIELIVSNHVYRIFETMTPEGQPSTWPLFVAAVKRAQEELAQPIEMVWPQPPNP